MTAEEELALAEAASDAARRQLTDTLVDIQARLRPRVLVREAIDELRETGVGLLRDGLTYARQHPGPVIGIATTIAAVVTRRWFVTAADQAKTETTPGEPVAPIANPAKKSAKKPKPAARRSPRRTQP